MGKLFYGYRLRARQIEGVKCRRQQPIKNFIADFVSFEKRIEIILKAFKTIEKDDRMLVIAGSGPSVGDLKETAKQLGIKNIIFTGYLKESEISDVYSSADIFASASTRALRVWLIKSRMLS